MQKVHSRLLTFNSKKAFLSSVLASLFILSTLYFLLYTPTRAQQTRLISITPETGDLKTNEEKIIRINLKSDSGISGFDLKFNSSGGLLITSFREQPSFNEGFDLFDSRQIASEINGSNSRVGYIFTAPTSRLPKDIVVYATVKASSGGTGKITLDYNNSQILSGSGQVLEFAPISASYNLNTTQSSPSFLNTATIPPVKYPDSAAVVDLRLQLAGSIPNPKINSTKALAVVVGRIGEGKYETQPQQFDLTPNADGTYSGKVAFPNFKDGNKFSIMVKVDKYLLRRICNPDPTEQKVGGYVCEGPNLTIRKGEPNNFDFSKIALLPGDLGLIDGILNGYDLNIVRMNLGKNSTEAVASADLNYDGIVDQKDFDLIKSIAANTRREADK